MIMKISAIGAGIGSIAFAISAFLQTNLPTAIMEGGAAVILAGLAVGFWRHIQKTAEEALKREEKHTQQILRSKEEDRKLRKEDRDEERRFRADENEKFRQSLEKLSGKCDECPAKEAARGKQEQD